MFRSLVDLCVKCLVRNGAWGGSPIECRRVEGDVRLCKRGEGSTSTDFVVCTKGKS